MTTKAAAWKKRVKSHSVDGAVYFYHFARTSIVENALHPCAHAKGCTSVLP